jgi:hypothetical protein
MGAGEVGLGIGLVVSVYAWLHASGGTWPAS